MPRSLLVLIFGLLLALATPALAMAGSGHAGHVQPSPDGVVYIGVRPGS